MKSLFKGWVSFTIIFLVFSSYTFSPLPTGKDEMLLKYLMTELHRYHYQRQNIDDDFSRKTFDLYLTKLDPLKEFLTLEDIHKLETYKSEIDDQIISLNFEFFELSESLYLQRVAEAEDYYKEILSQPFDFEIEESIETDFDKLSFARDQEQLKDYWRKRLKYEVLRRINRKLEAQENLEDKSEVQTFDEIEANMREGLKNDYDDRFDRLSKINDTDIRSIYYNSIANIYDPHTVYFPPKEKEDFDIQISGQFEGIGARLVEREGLIEVTDIIVGGPCYKQGELEVGDKILTVGQGDEEPVNVVGMRVDDAVLMIRGKKGTEVKLTVQKKDGSEQIISITRDVVQLEEAYAKSVMLKESDDDKGIGYIYLPKFYANFDDPKNGRRCAVDVAKEIEKLKADGVRGIILDLRNNGGGALNEVVDMTGLFIEKGPIVQVKSRMRKPYILEDKDPSVHYDGPLAVLVNSYSASASEILAAAIQDYERGVIIGDDTFGKGTVQRLLNLNRYDPNGPQLGGLKLTIQKFYRINGGATQKKGVIPDIVLPYRNKYIPTGEKEEEYSMAWDEIEPVKYETWKELKMDMDELREKSESRVEQNDAFQLIEESALYYKEQSNRSDYPLSLTGFQAYQDEMEAKSSKYRSIPFEVEGFEASILSSDIPVVEADTNTYEKWNNWTTKLEKDPYIYEAFQVIEDMIGDNKLSSVVPRREE